MDVNFDFSLNGDETHMSASVTSNSIRDEGPLRTCSPPGPGICAQRGLWGVLGVLLTSSAEKVRKHVKRIGMVSLTALVGLQAFLCRIINTSASEPQHKATHFSMVIVNLPFLEAG